VRNLAGAVALAVGLALTGSKTGSKVWTFAGDNGNGIPGGPPADFSADEDALLAQPIAADDPQFDEDVLMPSLTADEQAAIQVEDWG
jgi:hypothetical protein